MRSTYSTVFILCKMLDCENFIKKYRFVERLPIFHFQNEKERNGRVIIETDYGTFLHKPVPFIPCICLAQSLDNNSGSMECEHVGEYELTLGAAKFVPRCPFINAVDFDFTI